MYYFIPSHHAKQQLSSAKRNAARDTKKALSRFSINKYFDEKRNLKRDGEVVTKMKNSIHNAKRTRATTQRLKKYNMVFFDISINNNEVVRIQFELFHNTTPITADNFKALCTSEDGFVY
ncbi:unnamed protein product [Adineta steineri]|nr:unnamed protein product [Adineta steineri]